MNSGTDKEKQGEINTENQTIVEEKIVKVTGDIQIRKYIKGRLLGKGGFAKCYEFTCIDTKRISAAKVVVKSSLVKSRAKQKLISEIKIHKALHNTGIVGFEHYFEDTDNVYILLEMCTNQTLNELIKRRKTLTEIEVQCYSIQLIKALKYLHSHRIIHRDLKLGNLFLTDKMELKVGDFGLATKLEFEGERKRTVCGTPNYMPPEIILKKDYLGEFSDIWSIGILMYTTLCGCFPFRGNNLFLILAFSEKELYNKILKGIFEIPAYLSNDARSLLQNILKLNPSERYDSKTVIFFDLFF